ncbi:hypothetical protein FRX31_007075 [Thalictrum thalictroides]|uniref:Uncharacterized protein n=1 Tax=Thalictrum thalictroides TaxID=46969 RepID=A0A7J6X3I2_THATH|nr:hypothetical protein FRX31_007075 [Thalictrum thalictroides]
MAGKFNETNKLDEFGNPTIQEDFAKLMKRVQTLNSSTSSTATLANSGKHHVFTYLEYLKVPSFVTLGSEDKEGGWWGI